MVAGDSSDDEFPGIDAVFPPWLADQMVTPVSRSPGFAALHWPCIVVCVAALHLLCIVVYCRALSCNVLSRIDCFVLY